MNESKIILSNFEILRPAFEMDQEQTLQWLLKAHIRAEETKNNGSWTEEERQNFKTSLSERLWHVACKPDKIAKRGHSLDDFLHLDWEKMRIYTLHESPYGSDLRVRLKMYEEIADGVFSHYFDSQEIPPQDLIHVTCTGYIAPSPAQKIVARKNWGDQTTITHAYHMGCHGAIAALRMAWGFLSIPHLGKARTDIVHTEFCTLHNNAAIHTSDQLVAQSLFADGFIKYSLFNTENKGLQLLATHEKIIPNSEKAMTWNLADWGFTISLAKEIPVLIARSLKDYLNTLCKKGGVSVEEVMQQAHFAIHPGGPKILQNIQDFFHLRDEQIKKSHDILRNYGNMSSATLPHIWESIANDHTIPNGTLVVSLAFGPGLSVCGALLIKCGY